MWATVGSQNRGSSKEPCPKIGKETVFLIKGLKSKTWDYLQWKNQGKGSEVLDVVIFLKIDCSKETGSEEYSRLSLKWRVWIKVCIEGRRAKAELCWGIQTWAASTVLLRKTDFVLN